MAEPVHYRFDHTRATACGEPACGSYAYDLRFVTCEACIRWFEPAPFAYSTGSKREA